MKLFGTYFAHGKNYDVICVFSNSSTCNITLAFVSLSSMCKNRFEYVRGAKNMKITQIDKLARYYFH